jgi:DNA-binding transcriptional ArsR family regulator
MSHYQELYKETFAESFAELFAKGFANGFAEKRPTVTVRGMSLFSHPARDAAHDARALHALTHPLRVRLLGLLRREGPATASQLARRTGLSSGSTSYHLRRLGAAGLADEDTGRGNGRDRWWRARPGEPESVPGHTRRLHDTALLLTAEETRRLHDEIWRVVGRYRRDGPGEAATAPPGARRVTLVTHLRPDPVDPA